MEPLFSGNIHAYDIDFRSAARRQLGRRAAKKETARIRNHDQVLRRDRGMVEKFVEEIVF
jgi:hypothetical protein